MGFLSLITCRAYDESDYRLSFENCYFKKKYHENVNYRLFIPYKSEYWISRTCASYSPKVFNLRPILNRQEVGVYLI